jgi:curved DNA-binding protein
VEFKDYYKILGVPRAATDDEIKKSFRKLAREFHPDVAKDKKRAEEKFKEINEAYEVLGDAAKRKKYDELGANWKSGEPFRPPPGWEQSSGGGARGGRARGRSGGVEFDLGGTGFSSFFEQLFGNAQRGGGGGFGRGDFGRDFVHGQGDFAARGQDVEADLLVTLEEAARGAVRAVTLRITDGQGRARNDTHKVRIPAGVREGQKLRLTGRGQAGAGGAEAGDLYLNVRYARHPDFTPDGADLRTELEIAPWEAALGAEVSVPTLDGRVSIRIPPGTPGGQKLRVRGRGLPQTGGAGDLLVELRIAVPAKLDAAERELWERLARESRFRPRET